MDVELTERIVFIFLHSQSDHKKPFESRKILDHLIRLVEIVG